MINGPGAPWNPRGAYADAQSLAPRESHRRNHVGISGDEDNRLDQPFERKRRDVQPDAHVNSLLDDINDEVTARHTVTRDRAEAPLGSAAETPATHHSVSTPYGEILRPRQIGQKLAMTARHRIASDRDFPAVEGAFGDLGA